MVSSSSQLGGHTSIAGRKSFSRLSLVSAALAVVASASLAPAAANLFLNLNGTNTWEDGANWIAGVPPTNADNAFIDSGLTASVSSTVVCFELQVGVGPNAYDAIGNPGGSGVLNLLSGATVNQDGNLVVGQSQSASVDSSGTINIASGAVMNIKGGNSLLGFFGDNAAGSNAPTVGTVNVNGGEFNWAKGDPRSTMWIGGESITNHYGKGVFNLNSGTATGGAIRVGDFGEGTLNVSGGTLTSNFYMAIGLGNNPNSGGGNVNVSGGVLNLAQITLNENKVNECVFTQSGGEINVGGVTGLDGYNFRIGYSDKGKGTYNMTGGTLNVSGNDLWVGRGKEGEMNISGSSVININTLPRPDRPNADYAIALGGINDGNATINQNGGTIFIAPTSLLGIFYQQHDGGTETYNLNAGTLTTNGITARGGTVVKTFNFNGGTLIANGTFTVPNPNPNFNNTANFFTTLSSGGGTVDTASFDVTWITELSGTGGLTKDGAGSLSLVGANTYTGTTTVNAGVLIASNTAGSATGTGPVSVAASGTLAGAGTIGGNATVNGTLAPGAVDVTGNLSFGGTLTTTAGSSTAIQLNAAADVDHVAVAGAATLGGKIVLSTTNGYVPASGQTHRVLDAASVSGHFSTVEGHQLSPDLWLAVTYDAIGVSVTAAIPGDANLNANVNFNDLLALAQNYGGSDKVWAQGDFDGTGIVGFNDLLILARHYGQSSSVDEVPANIAAEWALAQSLVPEPTTALGMLSLLCILKGRRREHH